MCSCRFINCDKCTNLVGDADNKTVYVCVGTGGIWEISVPSSQFCCESITALKNKVFKNLN